MGDRPAGTCQLCGAATWSVVARQCKKCYVSRLGGSGNPSWGVFSSVDPQQGRDRATRRKTLKLCERCKVRKAIDRHHKDGNPLNNTSKNLVGLCRRCHMIVDGRLERLIQRRRKRGA